MGRMCYGVDVHAHNVYFFVRVPSVYEVLREKIYVHIFYVDIRICAGKTKLRNNG